MVDLDDFIKDTIIKYQSDNDFVSERQIVEGVYPLFRGELSDGEKSAVCRYIKRFLYKKEGKMIKVSNWKLGMAMLEVDISSSGESLYRLVESVIQRDYNHESVIYPVLEKMGYTIIASNTRNDKFMNPDCYKIIDYKIHSYEVKNEVSPYCLKDIIEQVTKNGAWANSSTLIFVKGDEKILISLAKENGIGLMQLTPEKLNVLTNPIVKPIDPSISKWYLKNTGIAQAFLELSRDLQSSGVHK